MARSQDRGLQQAVVQRYCVGCHNTKFATAGLKLDAVNADAPGANAEIWEKVLHKVSIGAMPPPRLPRPDAAAVRTFTSNLESALDAAAAAHPVTGHVGVHRLNQVEYTNAVRDLLALDINGPAMVGEDDAGVNGFNKMAGALPVSPALVERYISAARKISRLALGDPRTVSVIDTYHVPKLLVQDAHTSDDLPFGTRGGFAFRHTFPVDGEYNIKVTLRRNLDSYLVGMGRKHQLEVRLDGHRLKTFWIGGEAPGKPAPSSFAGNILGSSNWEVYMQGADAGLDLRFPAQAGTRMVAVDFIEDATEPEGVAQPPQMGGSGVAYNELYDGYAAVDSIAVGGPFKITGPGETASRKRVFVCYPAGGVEEEPCARKILGAVARRAYRRPVTEADMRPIMQFYSQGRGDANFENGIEVALQRILTDPEFLFRFEAEPSGVAPGSIYQLTDLQLASRLSFFLWSSIPDDELIDLASRKQLSIPAVLEQQVRRMVADRKASALSLDFTDQWLELPKLVGAEPDPDEYPEFDENLRKAFATETRLFVESQIHADRSVVDLLSANYTFVNERLARHYRIPNIYGDSFRKVSFKDGERGGLLGQGSILTATSYANRTSPVLRGKWVLDNLLGAPPPAPPPGVPALPEHAANGKPASVRERLEEHRKNPVCAACHVGMDPLGFALENFDGVGQWHQSGHDGTKIDSLGVLPDGTRIDGAPGLRKLLLDRRDQFVEAFTEKLMSWAIGQPIEYYDLPAVRKIVRDAAAQDDSWSALIKGIAESVPFRMSTARTASSGTSAAVKTEAPEKNR